MLYPLLPATDSRLFLMQKLQIDAPLLLLTAETVVRRCVGTWEGANVVMTSFPAIVLHKRPGAEAIPAQCNAGNI